MEIACNCKSTYNNQCSNEVCLKYGSTNIMAEPRSKASPRLHHDVIQVKPSTNVPTMYQLPTSYSF